MTYYVRRGNTYTVTDAASIDLHESLPPGNFLVKQDQFQNFYLEQVDDFKINYKIYGATITQADRILSTYLDRENSTGVMLNGEKGAGKTLLAKLLAIKGAELKMPCILINAPWHGDGFNKLIQDIDQPCIVFFDEFEKVYDTDDQQHVLTLLDGVFPSKKLFVITCNDKWRIDSHMRNRPGRIFYMIDFDRLSNEFIREYCEDTLKNKTHIDSICALAVLYDNFNFDMLKAIVEEMNRYSESPRDAMALLNARPEQSADVYYDVRIKIVDENTGHSVELKEDQFYPPRWHGNPVKQIIHTKLHVAGGLDDEGDLMDPDAKDNSKSVVFSVEDIWKIDSVTQTFVYKKDNVVMELKRYVDKTYHAEHLF